MSGLTKLSRTEVILHSAAFFGNLIGFASGISEQLDNFNSELVKVGNGFANQDMLMIEETHKRNALYHLKYPAQGGRVGGWVCLVDWAAFRGRA